MTANTKIKPSAQAQLFRTHPHGLSAPGLFAKRPLLGLAMIIFGSLTFGSLAYHLRRSGSLSPWDMNVAQTFRDLQINAPWSWMEDLLFGVFLGREVVILTGTILAVYFFYKRFWRELTMLLLGLVGGGLIWYACSRYFDRPRPTDHLDVLPLAGPSFPSAPALLALLGYGLLAYLLVPKLPTRFWRWFVALLLILAIGMAGLSSLLFGTHYLSDVIAGYALGIAWAGLAFSLVERIFQWGMVAGQEGLQTAISLGGLRVPGLFQQRPMIGLALILLGCLGFAAIGYNLLANGLLVQLDLSMYKELLAQARAAPPSVNDVMLFGFFVGKQAVQWIALILSVYFLSQRYWLEFGILQISMQGGGFIKNLFIDYFARPRPPEQLGFVTPELPSFPSGHTMGTMICYAFLAYLLVPKMPSRFWKWTLSIAILLLVLFEGLSRIFHGNHYFTDVVGGYLLGMIWLVLVCTVMELIFLRNRAARESQDEVR